MGIESNNKKLRDTDAPKNPDAWKRLVDKYPHVSNRFSIAAPLKPESGMSTKAANEDSDHKYVQTAEQHTSISEESKKGPVCIADFASITFMTKPPVDPESGRTGWHDAYGIQQLKSGNYEVRRNNQRIAEFTAAEAQSVFLKREEPFSFTYKGKEFVSPEPVMGGIVHKALKEE